MNLKQELKDAIFYNLYIKKELGENPSIDMKKGIALCLDTIETVLNDLDFEPGLNLYKTGARVSFITLEGKIKTGEVIGYSKIRDSIRFFYIRTKNLGIYEVSKNNILSIERETNESTKQ